jgi:hypothetical protein
MSESFRVCTLVDAFAQVFGGAVAAFAPGSFMQVNYDMMDAALAAIQSFVPDGSRVCCQLTRAAGISAGHGLHLPFVTVCKLRCAELIHAAYHHCVLRSQVLDLHAGVGVIGEKDA